MTQHATVSSTQSSEYQFLGNCQFEDSMSVFSSSLNIQAAALVETHFSSLICYRTASQNLMQNMRELIVYQ